MRIALPITDDRISPVFDVARHLILIDVNAGREIRRTEVLLEETDLAPRAQWLANLGPKVLICGAISRPLEAMILSLGIEVIPETCGNAEAVLRAFLSGRLTDQAFVTPGCPGNRQRAGLRRSQSGHLT